MPRTQQTRWISQVKTESTHPPAGLFAENAATIAKTLASRKVSPEGPLSGLRMLNYFINRAGKGLNPSPRAELGKAKHLLPKTLHAKSASRKPDARTSTRRGRRR
jgi:Protein of unknown function (DUF3175)